MAVTALLELQFQPDKIDTAREVVANILKDTRAFEGCLGVDVLIDQKDPGRWVIYERWESPEADAAYRKWRATPEGAISELGALLAGAPALSTYNLADDV